MFTFIATILHLITSIFTGVGNVEATQITAEAQVETASVETMGNVEVKWGFVAMMIPIMSIPYAVWESKVLIWDKVFHMGVTDPLTGAIAWGWPVVLGGLFLHGMTNR